MKTITILEMMPCVEKLFVKYIVADRPFDYYLQIHGWAKVGITEETDEYKEVITIVPMVIEKDEKVLSIVRMDEHIDYKILTYADVAKSAYGTIR
jgi:hypothetical protein